MNKCDHLIGLYRIDFRDYELFRVSDLSKEVDPLMGKPTRDYKFKFCSDCGIKNKEI